MPARDATDIAGRRIAHAIGGQGLPKRIADCRHVSISKETCSFGIYVVRIFVNRGICDISEAFTTAAHDPLWIDHHCLRMADLHFIDRAIASALSLFDELIWNMAIGVRRYPSSPLVQNALRQVGLVVGVVLEYHWRGP